MRLVQHRPAPDHRLVVGHEVAHGEAAHPVGRGRQHHVAEDDRVVVDAEHLGHREAVDVGVEQTDPVAGLGQRDGQVDGDGRLADAALARGDTDDPGRRVGLEEGRRGALLAVTVPVPAVAMPVVLLLLERRRTEHGGAQRDAERGPLVVGHDGQIELDLIDAGHGPGHPVDLVGQFVGGRPGRHRQRDLDAGPVPPVP